MTTETIERLIIGVALFMMGALVGYSIGLRQSGRSTLERLIALLEKKETKS